jgi:hypothetical protein
MQAFNYSPSVSKKSIISVIPSLKSVGANVLEGYCFFCGKKVTLADVRMGDAVRVPIPGGKTDWSCSVHNHGSTPCPLSGVD